MEDDPFYAPFFRVMDETDSVLGIKRGIVDQKAPIKRIRGSGRDTNNLWENIARNTANIIKAGSRNYTFVMLTDEVDKKQRHGEMA